MRHFLQAVWDLQVSRQAMADCNLDLEQLPLGSLKRAKIMQSMEKIKKMESVLTAMAQGSIKEANERKLMQLSEEFHKILPYDFGTKRAPGIDNLFRAKERTKQLS